MTQEMGNNTTMVNMKHRAGRAILKLVEQSKTPEHGSSLPPYRTFTDLKRALPGIAGTPLGHCLNSLASPAQIPMHEHYLLRVLLASSVLVALFQVSSKHMFEVERSLCQCLHRRCGASRARAFPDVRAGRI